MYTALEDIKLETVDFKWIKETTKISHLKRAIRLIELDGDYFKELKDACYDRIGELDPSQRRINIDNRMTQQLKQQITKQLQEWQLSLQEKTPHQKIMSKQNPTAENKEQKQIDFEEYFDNEGKDLQKKSQKFAQNEKIKGNEALKSRDYQEAIRYYTKSLQFDPKMYQSYANRALVYLKIKEFQKAISDCSQALAINPQYVKAYHRKAKGLIGIKNKVQAYRTFQQALKLQPQNSEIVNELKQLRQEMNEQQIKYLQGNSNFKKIVIEQDSDDEQEEIIQN